VRDTVLVACHCGAGMYRQTEAKDRAAEASNPHVKSAKRWRVDGYYLLSKWSGSIRTRPKRAKSRIEPRNLWRAQNVSQAEPSITSVGTS
jgi:hypothetical protein